MWKLTALSHDVGDMLDNAFAVRCPGINAEVEVSARYHRRLRLPQSSSASRFTAGAAGFLNFNHARKRRRCRAIQAALLRRYASPWMMQKRERRDTMLRD